MIVTARPRIHMALADMGFATVRSYGGVGFALDEPATQLRISASTNNELIGFDLLDERGRTKIKSILDRFRDRFGIGACTIELIKSPPQHVGFGSQTCLSLALTAALNNYFCLGLSREELQILSQRGGASGIGINAFFDGGVLWDCGHSRENVQKYGPSGNSQPKQPPLLMLRMPFPESWRVVLVLPKANKMSGREEERFFFDNTPIPRNEAVEVIAEIVHGILPAYANADLKTLSSSLTKLHLVGFKARELANHSTNLQDALRGLQSRGFAAGISSFGPLIYVVRPQDDLATEEIRSHFSEQSLDWFGISAGFNGSYSVTQ